MPGIRTGATVPQVIELPAAKEQIEPLVRRLVAAHNAAAEAWASCVAERPAFTLPLDATARANIFHCHLRSAIEREFATDTTARPTGSIGVYGLLIGTEIFLRFKYVGHGAPSNVATRQQQMMARQEYDDDMRLALTGDAALKMPTVLTCGYTVDAESIGRIEIRRDCQGHLPWCYDIYGGDAVTMPQALPGQADTTKPARVTKKIAAKGKDAADAKAAS